MILPYYKIEKTKDGKQFFYSHEGYFNFWDEYLIMNIMDKKFYAVLINRPCTKFPKYETSEEYNSNVNSQLADSVYLRKPEEMFEDFPELDKYEYLKKYSKYNKV